MELLCPIVACDKCGRDIHKEQGNVLLPEEYRDPQHFLQLDTLKVFHTGCDPQTCQPWRPLDEFLAQILNNTEHTVEALYKDRAA